MTRFSIRLSWTLFAVIAGIALVTPAQAEQVTFKTSDGFSLVGDLHADAPEAPAVILLHMYRSRRQAWEPLLPRLRAAGYTVLALDQRAHGGSTQQNGKTVRVEGIAPGEFGAVVRAGVRDVAAARDLLAARKLGKGGVVLMGASYGCSVSLLAAADRAGIAAAVLLSPGTRYFGVDVLPAAREFEGKLLAVAAEDDRGSARSTRALSEAHAGQDPPTIFPTGGHGTRLFESRPEVMDLIVEFLARASGR